MVKPSLIIVGAQRAATTTLYNLLLQHQDIVGPAGKETHFFDEWWPNSPGNMEVYASLLTDNGARLPRGRQVIEATPLYCFYPLAIHRMASVLPDVKLVMVLREPVARAMSHYHHDEGGGMLRHAYHLRLSSFDSAMLVSRAYAMARRVQRRKGIEVGHVEWGTMSYWDRGLYDVQVQRLYDYYPPEQIRIVLYDQVVNDFEWVANALAEWMGLFPYTPTHRHHNNQSYTPFDFKVRMAWHARYQRKIRWDILADRLSGVQRNIVAAWGYSA